MAASAIKYSALGTPLANLILGAGVAPTAKALANNGLKLSSEYDNTSGRFTYGHFILRCRGASAFSAGGYAALYFITAADGTNYADSAVAPGHAFVASLSLDAVATQQRLEIRNVQLPAGKFKVLLVNKGGQAFTNTDAENTLDMVPFDFEAQ